MSNDPLPLTTTAVKKEQEQQLQQSLAGRTAQQSRSLQQASPPLDIAPNSDSEQARMSAPLQAITTQPVAALNMATTSGNAIATISTQVPPHLQPTTGNPVVNNTTTTTTSHPLNDTVTSDSTDTSINSPQNTTPTSTYTSGSTATTTATKKSLIETRRAEQNRAAQRAFRQRKEKYVKELETKVNMMAEWKARMDHLEQENQQLKRRIEELETQQHQREDSESMARRTANKVNYNDTAYTNMQKQQQQSHHREGEGESEIKEKPSSPASLASAGAVPHVGEKGKVLDDLVSILRTRHRPPIPSHPPN